MSSSNFSWLTFSNKIFKEVIVMAFKDIRVYGVCPQEWRFRHKNYYNRNKVLLPFHSPCHPMTFRVCKPDGTLVYIASLYQYSKPSEILGYKYTEPESRLALKFIEPDLADFELGIPVMKELRFILNDDNTFSLSSNKALILPVYSSAGASCEYVDRMELLKDPDRFMVCHLLPHSVDRFPVDKLDEWFDLLKEHNTVSWYSFDAMQELSERHMGTKGQNKVFANVSFSSNYMNIHFFSDKVTSAEMPEQLKSAYFALKMTDIQYNPDRGICTLSENAAPSEVFYAPDLIARCSLEIPPYVGRSGVMLNTVPDGDIYITSEKDQKRIVETNGTNAKMWFNGGNIKLTSSDNHYHYLNAEAVQSFELKGDFYSVDTCFIQSENVNIDLAESAHLSVRQASSGIISTSGTTLSASITDSKLDKVILPKVVNFGAYDSEIRELVLPATLKNLIIDGLKVPTPSIELKRAESIMITGKSPAIMVKHCSEYEQDDLNTLALQSGSSATRLILRNIDVIEDCTIKDVSFMWLKSVNLKGNLTIVASNKKALCLESMLDMLAPNSTGCLILDFRNWKLNNYTLRYNAFRAYSSFRVDTFEEQYRGRLKVLVKPGTVFGVSPRVKPVPEDLKHFIDIGAIVECD